MKITDLRTSRVFSGEHVATIAGNSQPTDEQLAQYYGVGPRDKSYPHYKKPTTHKRMVLKHDLGHHVITVNSKFYRVEK